MRSVFEFDEIIFLIFQPSAAPQLRFLDVLKNNMRAHREFRSAVKVCLENVQRPFTGEISWDIRVAGWVLPLPVNGRNMRELPAGNGSVKRATRMRVRW